MVLLAGRLATNAAAAELTGKDRGDVSKAIADLLAAGVVVRLPKHGREIPIGLREG